MDNFKVRDERLRKIFTVFIGLIIIIGGYVFLLKDNQNQEEPKLFTELIDKGEVNGKREFLFGLTNVGENKTTIQFPSWLEYNYVISNLDNKELPTGLLKFEHPSLNEGNKEGRELLLEPNQKIEYRLLVGNLPQGNYKISMWSTSGYGGTREIEFKLDSNTPGIEGYVVDIEDGRFLVVSPVPKDFSSMGGIKEFYDAIWFSNTPIDIQMDQKVQVWFDAVATSYPGQSGAQKVSILQSNKPNNANLTEAEAIKKALEIEGNNGYPVIKAVYYDEISDVWAITIKFFDFNEEEHEINVQIEDQ